MEISEAAKKAAWKCVHTFFRKDSEWLYRSGNAREKIANEFESIIQSAIDEATSYLEAAYYELIYAVEKKHRGETPWETFTRPGNHDICENRHLGADTSVLANPSQHSKVESQKTILAALQRAGEASCERLEIVTGISHQSASARLSELLRDNRIKITGRTTTISGKPARLYKIA